LRLSQLTNPPPDCNTFPFLNYYHFQPSKGFGAGFSQPYNAAFLPIAGVEINLANPTNLNDQQDT